MQNSIYLLFIICNCVRALCVKIWLKKVRTKTKFCLWWVVSFGVSFPHMSMDLFYFPKDHCLTIFSFSCTIYMSVVALKGSLVCKWNIAVNVDLWRYIIRLVWLIFQVTFYGTSFYYFIFYWKFLFITWSEQRQSIRQQYELAFLR